MTNSIYAGHCVFYMFSSFFFVRCNVSLWPPEGHHFLWNSKSYQFFFVMCLFCMTNLVSSKIISNSRQWRFFDCCIAGPDASIINAVHSFAAATSTEAPFSPARYFTISRWPFLDATINTVHPFATTVSTDAPFSLGYPRNAEGCCWVAPELVFICCLHLGCLCLLHCCSWNVCVMCPTMRHSRSTRACWLVGQSYTSMSGIGNLDICSLHSKSPQGDVLPTGRLPGQHWRKQWEPDSGATMCTEPFSHPAARCWPLGAYASDLTKPLLRGTELMIAPDSGATMCTEPTSHPAARCWPLGAYADCRPVSQLGFGCWIEFTCPFVSFFLWVRALCHVSYWLQLPGGTDGGFGVRFPQLPQLSESSLSLSAAICKGVEHFQLRAQFIFASLLNLATPTNAESVFDCQGNPMLFVGEIRHFESVFVCRGNPTLDTHPKIGAGKEFLSVAYPPLVKMLPPTVQESFDETFLVWRNFMQGAVSPMPAHPSRWQLGCELSLQWEQLHRLGIWRLSHLEEPLREKSAVTGK